MSAAREIRRRLRPIRRLAEAFRTRIKEFPYRFSKAPLGSAEWLAHKEVIYGGYTTGVARRKVSARDLRSREELSFGGMTGGDRMLQQGYGTVYANYLAHFSYQSDLMIAELGILKGTGLAIWCDLFASARVLGFDIDLQHFANNYPNLVRRGAFQLNSPELYGFDQLMPDSAKLAADLQGRKLDIVIDDGLHSIEAIITSWRVVRPHLAPNCVYFIEDFDDLLGSCSSEFTGFDAKAFGPMTVVSRGLVIN